MRRPATDRVLAVLLALAAALLALPAWASVTVHFQSFNGSVLFGRYPHTFVVLQGTLDATGQPIDENYGFTARRVTPAILSGPVEHDIMVEEPKYIDSTNRHFSVTVPDEVYWRIREEVDAWRDLPGRGYDLEQRNCIHFVGAIARIVGLSIDYPERLMRKPKAWLNLMAQQNPWLNAREID
ncbi:hypothetical protein A9D14_11860 [Croceicoccus marinus]|uniref:Uncharacterized protein n=1 Tax=Croceicoccus marinus TaxID=450378 RepID=A0A1Z1FFD0_9SPHN|nr:hypothetical protein A9D14_11860 [Croceicoccus marinus]